jgi:hypothetical protein
VNYNKPTTQRPPSILYARVDSLGLSFKLSVMFVMLVMMLVEDVLVQAEVSPIDDGVHLLLGRLEEEKSQKANDNEGNGDDPDVPERVGVLHGFVSSASLRHE